MNAWGGSRQSDQSWAFIVKRAERETLFSRSSCNKTQGSVMFGHEADFYNRENFGVEGVLMTASIMNRAFIKSSFFPHSHVPFFLFFCAWVEKLLFFSHSCCISPWARLNQQNIKQLLPICVIVAALILYLFFYFYFSPPARIWKWLIQRYDENSLVCRRVNLFHRFSSPQVFLPHH